MQAKAIRKILMNLNVLQQAKNGPDGQWRPEDEQTIKDSIYACLNQKSTRASIPNTHEHMLDDTESVDNEFFGDGLDAFMWESDLF